MVILIVFDLAIDFYLLRRMRRAGVRRLWKTLFVVLALLMAATGIVAISLPLQSGGEDVFLTVMDLVYIFLSLFVAKFLFMLFDVVSGLPKLWCGGRFKALTWIGGCVAVAVVAIMAYGSLVTRYDLQTNEAIVGVEGLPESFENYKIVQFSDLHTGSFGTDTAYVSRLVDNINAIDADVIVFTGDLVNRRTSELEPFVSVLSRLKAKDGVYSILGNHDYGDYSTWPDSAAKRANLTRLIEMEEGMGWKMLNNATEWLRRGNDSIALIGVENIGEPPFPTYGSLEQAYGTLSDDNVKILLSHNPRHWDSSIRDNDSANVTLTLSGHTHAMQMEFFGKSPSSLRYPEWGGLYTDGGERKLYVNIGSGTIGMPARLGRARPEITVIILQTLTSEDDI